MKTKPSLFFALFSLLLPALVAGPLSAQDAAAQKKKPNILFILADDLGYSDLGCYGGEIATPNLDALAADGLRFTQFYNTARCWPSRAAVMTGYYAQEVRRDTFPGVKIPAGGGKNARPKWAPLLSERLKPLGYRTYHSGKWHIDGKPLQSGFDRSFQIEGGQNSFFNAKGITAEGEPVEQTPDFYLTDAVADHAIDCLKEHAEKFGDQPFFHYLCFTCPHFPLMAPQEAIDRYADTYTPGWNVIQAARFERQKEMGLVDTALPPMEREVGPPYDFPEAFKILGPGEINRPLPWNELSDAQRKFQASKMSIHAAMVDIMDRDIGRVLGQLKAMDEWNDTLIFFASDNGASAEIMVRGGGHDPDAPMGSADSYLCLGPGWSSSCNTPFRRHKTWTHEGGISSPLIVHWPNGFSARGELRKNPGHLVDIVPTVMDVAGGTIPSTWNGLDAPAPSGKSLAPAFTEDGTVKHEAIWWYHEGNRALRMGDWKLVAAKGTDWELYDLSQDRGETTNLAAQYPEKVQQMEAAWQERYEETLKWARKGLPASP